MTRTFLNWLHKRLDYSCSDEERKEREKKKKKKKKRFHPGNIWNKERDNEFATNF